MRRLWALGIVALAGCGSSGSEPPDPRCGDPAAVERVATGGDGPLLSECVRRATAELDLQEVGAAISTAAERLGDRERGEPLGFLIGAVRRGTGTSGVQAELVNRVEAVARTVQAQDEAIRRGIRAGEARG